MKDQKDCYLLTAAEFMDTPCTSPALLHAADKRRGKFLFYKVTLTFVTYTGPHAITSLASPPTADKEAVSLWTEEPLQWSWNCCSTRCIRCLCPAKEVPLNKTYGVSVTILIPMSDNIRKVCRLRMDKMKWYTDWWHWNMSKLKKSNQWKSILYSLWIFNSQQ